MSKVTISNNWYYTKGHIISSWFEGQYLILKYIYCREVDEPACVKAQLDSPTSPVFWSKVACTDTSSPRVICQRNFNYHDIPGCYGQPPSEVDDSKTHTLSDTNKDLTEVCAEKCKGHWYFDMSEDKTKCHCLDKGFPQGGKKCISVSIWMIHKIFSVVVLIMSTRKNLLPQSVGRQRRASKWN